MSGTPAASSAEGSTQASAVARSAEGRATAVHARPPAGAPGGPGESGFSEWIILFYRFGLWRAAQYPND